ncbi:MAG: hypothetical protein VB875_15135, partial [Pirellulales bacterium]
MTPHREQRISKLSRTAIIMAVCLLAGTISPQASEEATVTARENTTPPNIQSLSFGFAGRFKVGYWTPVRATGAHIKGTNGRSSGIVPFLNVADATAVAVNQGGKRKGAVCAYLELWHADMESFLELRKNTGDDRRRTHDMNT